MSYTVFIEVPPFERLKPKRGEYPPAALQRLALIAATLSRLDPDAGLTQDDGLVEADSAKLGAVIADPNRITLQFRAAQGYSALLNAFHAALGAFEPLGFVGSDPQVGGVIRYFADGPTFLRQFRSQIICPDDEFEQWIHGIEPPAWAPRRQARQRLQEAYTAENFAELADLPYHQEVLAMTPAAREALLARVVAHNDAVIARLNLRDDLVCFADSEGPPRHRADGSPMPFEIWLYTSSLGQEMWLASYRPRPADNGAGAAGHATR